MPRKKKPPRQPKAPIVNPPIETVGPPPGEAAPEPPPVEQPTQIPPEPPRVIVPKAIVEDIRAVFAELAARKIEALNLYEPLPSQAAFHECMAPERIVRGSNRAGKTLATHVEGARAVLGRDPYQKFPRENGRAFLVGYRGQELGQVNYRKLFRPGAFKIVRDPKTNQWRAFRPWDANDIELRRFARPAPPLIPERFVESIAWENKKNSIPAKATFTSGWEMSFFSSQGKPPTGSDIDFAIFDEEITDCLAGWSVVYDPVADVHRRVDQIDAPFHVWSFNTAIGQWEVKRASKPFIKRFGEITRIRLSNGEEMFATRRHRVLAADGRWVTIQEAFSSQLSLVPSDAGDEPLRRVCELESKVSETVSPRLEQKRRRWSQRLSCHATRKAFPTLLCSRLQEPSHPLHRELKCAGVGSEYCVPGECSGRSKLLSGTVSRSCLNQNRHTANGVHHQKATATSSRSILPVCETMYAPMAKQVLGSQVHYSGDCRQRDEHVRPSAVVSQGGSPSQSDVQRSDHSSKRLDGLARTGRCSRVVSQGDIPVLDRAASFGVSVIVESVEDIGEFDIWDFSVSGNKNYVNAGVVNHNSDWYPEISARLVDRNGKFVWGATPQAGTEQLYDLCLTAQDLAESGEPNPRIVEFMLLLADNPHISEKAKRELEAKFSDPQQYDTRVRGEFALVSFRFFPEFHPSVHGIKGFPIPPEWTRYAITDPGHQPGSVLFAAVPPPDTADYGKHVIVYDELVIPNCNAVVYGREMAKKCVGQKFQAFIIDGRAGRITDMGSGRTLEEQYMEQLKANKVKSFATGHGFKWGSDNFEAGAESVRTWLQLMDDGKPKLLYFKDRLRTFPKQMERYHYKKTGELLSDRPVKKNDHTVDCCRYLCAFGCPYVKPKAPPEPENYVLTALKKKREAAKQRSGKDSVDLWPRG